MELATSVFGFMLHYLSIPDVADSNIQNIYRM